MRVLLVGSRQRPTGTLADWLRDRGHEVRRINRSALTKRGLHEFRPQFVVLSSTVGAYVAQVCRLLRRAGTRAPIIAAGLATNSVAAEELLDAGADEVVESPLDRSRFDTRVAALERRVHAADPDLRSGAYLDPASLRSLLEAFPDRIFSKDRQLRFTWANRATLDRFGMHDLDQLIGKTDLDVHDPKIARPSARRDRRLLKTGEALVNEEGTFVAAGERVWVLGTRVPVFDAAGLVTGLVGMTRDITELKRAQLQQEESEARLRGLIEHSPDLVALVRDRVLVFANRPGAAMVGASGPDALVGRALLDFVSDEHQAVLGARLSAAQTDGEATERLEVMARRLDGSTFSAEVSVVPTVLDGDPAVQVVARDVSEASAARDALRLADEKWRSLVTNAPDTISMIDRDGRFLFINRTTSGMPPEDVVGLTIFDVSSPDKHAEARALLHRIFEKGESGAIEAEMTGTDGAVRWWSTRFAPVRQGDAVVAAVMISTDITERRAAEEELRRREGHYRTLASHIPESIVILFDADLCVTMAEGEMLHRRGQVKEDIEGRSLADVVPAEVRDRAIDACRRAVQGHSTRYKIELQEHVFEVQALPVRNSTGEIFAGILMVQDISPRTSAEAAMHKATAEFEGVFRCMPNPAVVTTADGTINVVNPSFAALFGYGSADVVGQSTRVLYADARDFAPLSELARSDQPVESNEHGEVWFRRRDGTLFLGESAATALVDAQGSLFGYVMILDDVTEQKRTEAMIHARATQQAEVARLGQRALA